MDSLARATPTAEADGETVHAGRRADDPALVIVRSLAPLLGLDPSRVRIERGASAAARSSNLILGPTADRGVIAHELAHVAQHANRDTTVGPRPDATAAEREAAGIGAAALAGTALWRPRAVLPAGRVARLADASGVAPAQSAGVAALGAKLVALVGVTREGEIKRIAAELADMSTWSWDSVETGLQILAVYDFVTARAIARALPREARVRLAHLNDDHHKQHPVAAAAVLAALERDDVKEFLSEAGGPPRLNEGQGLRATLEDAVHGIQAEGLGPEALRGLLEALRLVPQETLVKLTRGDRREAFRDLLATPTPTGDDGDALHEAINREQRVADAAEDASAVAIVAKLEGIVTSTNEGPARLALDALEQVATQAAGAPDVPAGAAPAMAATNAPPTPSELLRAVVARLDAAGLVERILDGLPAADRYEGRRSVTLVRVLAARAPALTLRRIESRLSYAWNDWAVTDADARFAYFLVRTLSIDVQDTWRTSEGGKWFNRLLDNLPNGMVESGDYTGVGSEFVTGPPGEKGANPTEVNTRLKTLLNLWHQNHTEINARWVARLLLGLDPETGRPLVGSDTDLPIRRAVVRRFDALQELRNVYEHLPESYLLGAQTRQEVLDLTAMRDPFQVEMHAAALLNTGIFDWITSREAWTAYQLIRMLPSQRQQQFEADDPNRYSGMLGAMTTRMRLSSATSALTGRGQWPGRKQLRDRLSDPRLWDRKGARAPELRALCVLAMASDDAAFVFAQSQLREAYLYAPLRPIVAALHLYDPKQTPEYTPESLETRSLWGELERFVDHIVVDDFGLVPVRWVLAAAGAWLLMNWISVGGKSIHVSDADLSWAQWANGGNLGGAVLADKPRTGEQAPAATPWSGATTPSGPNRLSSEVDLATGTVRLRMTELALDRLNIVRPGSSYRTGAVSVKNLYVQADFSDRHYRKPVGIKLKTAGVEVDDFVAANSSLPGRAWALSHLSVKPFEAEGGAIGNENFDAEVPREGQTIPIPVFSYLLDALANVIAWKGAIPFDKTVLDIGLMPFTSGLSFAGSHVAGTAANALIPTPAPGDYIWGFASDGVLRPPRSTIDRVKDATAMLRSFHVHFDELHVDGLTMGAGTQVSSLVLRDLDLGVGLNRPAYLRQLLRSLQKLERGIADGPDREATRRRIAEVTGELKGSEGKPGLEELEAELEKLERKDRWEAGALSARERARLAELSDLLRGDAGATLDIGAITVGRVSGAVEAEGGSIRGIHLEGRLPLGPSGYYADEDLVSRFVAGGRDAPTVADLARKSDVRLTIASTELVQGAGGEPTLRFLAEKVPTVEELSTRIAALSPTVDASLRDRLVEAKAIIAEIDSFRVGEPTLAVQDRITELTRRVRRLLGVSVGILTLGPITGGLSEEGALTATVHGIDAKGVKGDIAGQGFAIRQVTGDLTLGVGGLTALDVGVSSLGSATGKARARNALTGRFGLDARIEGITTEMGDLGEVSISGLAGDVSMLADGYAVRHLRATRLAAGGINLGVAGARVTGKSVALEGLDLDAEVHYKPDRTLDSAKVPRLDVKRIAADALVYEATDADTGEGVRADIVSGGLVDVRVQDLVVAWDSDGVQHLSAAGSLGAVDDLRYKVLMSALDSASRTLKQTTVTSTVTAGGAEGAPPVLAAAFAQDGKERKITLDVTALRLLGTEVRTPDGSVIVRRLTLGGRVTDSTKDGQTFDVTVGDVDVGRIRWKIGTARVSGDGAITLRSVHATGTRKPDGALRVDELELAEVDASDLSYVDGAIDVHLGRFDKKQPGLLHIRRIHLSGLAFDKEGNRAPGAHVDILGSHLDFKASVAAGIKASGQIDAQAIAIDLYRGDSFAVRLRGIGGDVAVDMNGLHGHAVLDGLGADSISVTPSAVKVSGLHIDQISLDALRVVNPTTPGRFALATDPEGTIDVLGIDFTARLDRWLPGESHPADQPFKKLAVEQFEIQRIQAEGLTLDLPDDGVRIQLPIRYASDTGVLPEMATLHHIWLSGEKPGTGFEYVPGKAGHLSGVAHLDSAAIPSLLADIKDRFKGDVSLNTNAASIGFLEKGGRVIDIKNPRAALKDPATLSRYDQTVVFSELGAESVHVADGKTEVTGAHLDNLRFEQPGVVVEIPTISAPGTIEVWKSTGKIPILQIDNAKIHVGFGALAASGSGGSGGGAAPAFVLGPGSLAGMLDGLQGGLSMNVLVKIVDLPVWLNNRDLNAPVDLQFTNGKLDYKSLQSGLNKGVTMKMADEENANSPGLGNFAARALEFWMDGPKTLVLGLHLTDMPTGGPDDQSGQTVPILKSLVRWNLETGEIDDAAAGKLRLFRAIGPEKKKSSGGGGEEPALVDTLEFRNIVANLSVESKKSIPFDFVRPPVIGSITFAPNAIMGLHVEGGVSANVRPPSRWSDPEPKGLSAVSLDAVNIESTSIVLLGGGALSTESITITKLKNGSLGFNRQTPANFDATIEKAVAKNIRWVI